MRLFIGIPLPGQYQEMLGLVRKKWESIFKSKLTWTKPGNWHLTLKFLGDVEKNTLQDLERIMKDLDSRSFFLEGSGAGFFGSKGVYRVAWLGLKNDVPALVALAGQIDQSLEGIGFEKEKRPFRGHLTLARIRKFYRNDPWNEFAEYVGGLEWPGFEVREVVLWQSILGRSGPRYETVVRAALS